jgi:hypothetical protein
MERVMSHVWVIEYFTCPMHVIIHIKMEINIYAVLSATHHQTVYSTVRIPPSDPLVCHTQSVTNKHFIWQLEWSMKNNTACPPLFDLQRTFRDYPLAILTMKLRVCCKEQWKEE